MSKPKSGLFDNTKGCRLEPSKNAHESNESMGFSTENITNKYHHIFHNIKHNLKEFLKSFNNDEEAAYNKLNEEYNKYIKNNSIKNGFLIIKVNINGFEITIRGYVIDGVGNIGTAYIGEN